ncbi:MAG: 1-acyl-sn-glycerol-3-phosphate acyltransferase [Bacteroidaceae bacterium]|nr:1-acyl-sn-glycerol-3-phosphate acyltransferase [Bacteroidaceae bacterium]
MALQQAESEFDAIRPYRDDEVKSVVKRLIYDRQLNKLMSRMIPWLPARLRTWLLRMALVRVDTTLKFQKRFMRPVVNYVISKYTRGVTFEHDSISPEERYTFMSNHRDIVLDSAILSKKLLDAKFPTTCEIAIGDNLLIYPWIKRVVRLNKAFTVKRGLSPRELLQSSQLVSRYMHYAITQKRENIWIAQREGRAKDSNDRTQESVLKMLSMGGEGSVIDCLRDLHIVPLSISYEYDPCDYLKAQEFQQKRDNPSFRKSQHDDLDNMKTGILGYKGRVHYHAAACINEWLDELKDLSKTEIYTAIAHRIDQEIHAGYRLYPGNYVALDELNGTQQYRAFYSKRDKRIFDTYVRRQLKKVRMADADLPYLRERILTMYANPVINKLKLEEGE